MGENTDHRFADAPGMVDVGRRGHTTAAESDDASAAPSVLVPLPEPPNVDPAGRHPTEHFRCAPPTRCESVARLRRYAVTAPCAARH